MGDVVAALLPPIVVAVAFVVVIVAIIRNQGGTKWPADAKGRRTVMAPSRSAISPLPRLARSSEIRFP